MTAPGVQGSEAIFKTMDLTGNWMGKEKCKVVSRQQMILRHRLVTRRFTVSGGTSHGGGLSVVLPTKSSARMPSMTVDSHFKHWIFPIQDSDIFSITASIK